ncbi:MAG: (2Fe-2S) ferredoxin domain-containing protein [Erysipelotrichaceae bacterium]|nr:(2Fe-2S) ferredoxin domain-containing protein [Erysipelotrichaceae bacterium]
MRLSVCVGSSCHLKGSYEIIQIFKKEIEDRHLEDKIELKASFCLGHCTSGVAVRVDDEFLDNINPENARERFINDVLSKVE